MCKTFVEVLTKTNKSIVYLEKFPRHYKSTPHQHNNKETFHVYKGNGYIYNNGSLTHLSKGMRCVVEPKTYHNIITMDETLECYGVIEGDDDKEILELFYDFMKSHR